MLVYADRENVIAPAAARVEVWRNWRREVFRAFISDFSGQI